MADIIPIGQQIGNVPASMRQRMATTLTANKSFSSNVMTSYPMLSIRGKEFTFRLPDGRSSRHEANGFALPYIDVVLVEGSPLLSKTFYAKGFDPTEFTRPDCWSLDSVKPDPSSPALQEGYTGPICATCKQNQFGSKITDAGKKIKACSDYRRIAVLLPQQIGSEMATPLGMRVPQSSLKNLKAHAELLERYGVNMQATVTRLSFTQEAFPQLAFTYVSILNEPQWNWVMELAASPLVQGMVLTPDFENAISTPEQETPMHNEGLKPLEPAPPATAFDKLMGSTNEPVEPVQQAQPATQQAKPEVQQATASNIIQLPDGRWLDTATKQFVEAPPAEPEVADDPDTMTLSDGKFYNRRLNAYVTGPGVDATVVGAEKAKAPAKKPAKAKAAAVEAPAEAAAQAGAAEPGSLGALAAAAQASEAQVQQPEKPKVAAKSNGNGGVVPASAAIDALIKAASGEPPK
jgi:hypothetical protein